VEVGILVLEMLALMMICTHRLAVCGAVGISAQAVIFSLHVLRWFILRLG